jgi:hypothetical protein
MSSLATTPNIRNEESQTIHLSPLKYQFHNRIDPEEPNPLDPTVSKGVKQSPHKYTMAYENPLQ